MYRCANQREHNQVRHRSFPVVLLFLFGVLVLFLARCTPPCRKVEARNVEAPETSDCEVHKQKFHDTATSAMPKVSTSSQSSQTDTRTTWTLVSKRTSATSHLAPVPFNLDFAQRISSSLHCDSWLRLGHPGFTTIANRLGTRVENAGGHTWPC